MSAFNDIQARSASNSLSSIHELNDDANQTGMLNRHTVVAADSNRAQPRASRANSDVSVQAVVRRESDVQSASAVNVSASNDESSPAASGGKPLRVIAAKEQQLEAEHKRIGNLIDPNVYREMIRALNDADSADEVASFMGLENQIREYARLQAAHCQASGPQPQQPLASLQKIINTGQYARDCCVSLLSDKETFGFSAGNAEAFVNAKTTPHCTDPEMLRRELEQIASAPDLIPSGLRNKSKAEGLNALLSARDDTRRALLDAGCPDKQITSAMWASKVERLQQLQAFAERPDCKQLVEADAEAGEEARAAMSSGDPVEPAGQPIDQDSRVEALIDGFQFSPANAQKFLGDKRTPCQDDPQRLLAHLEAIRETPGMVPDTRLNFVKCRRLWDALNARVATEDALCASGKSIGEALQLMQGKNVEQLQQLRADAEFDDDDRVVTGQTIGNLPLLNGIIGLAGDDGDAN